MIKEYLTAFSWRILSNLKGYDVPLFKDYEYRFWYGSISSNKEIGGEL